MLDGRVKTLHPKIHAGILAKRDNPDHMKQLQDAGITPIDLVAVNLYPFKQTIEKPETTEAQAIEQIDIGGPSMLRAAAKNFAGVLTVVDPADYQPVVDALKAHKDDADFRKHLAAKVFRHTAAYDALISNYMTEEEFPEKLTLTYEKQQSLRYGENSHQKAAFYRKPIPSKLSIIPNQLHGKELSYNNIKDANAALNMVAEFDQPAVIAMKHMNPVVSVWRIRLKRLGMKPMSLIQCRFLAGLLPLTVKSMPQLPKKNAQNFLGNCHRAIIFR